MPAVKTSRSAEVTQQETMEERANPEETQTQSTCYTQNKRLLNGANFKHPFWTVEELNLLREAAAEFPGQPKKISSTYFKGTRTHSSVQHKLNQLGLLAKWTPGEEEHLIALANKNKLSKDIDWELVSK